MANRFMDALKRSLEEAATVFRELLDDFNAAQDMRRLGMAFVQGYTAGIKYRSSVRRSRRWRVVGMLNKVK